ncbi:MAG: hypothetical protein LIP05_00230 [Tannerellaceae bacterium]|nr:hypothetical protein [Tannerellaceae bacterium]
METLVTRAAIVRDDCIPLETLDQLLTRNLFTKYQFDDEPLFSLNEIRQYQQYKKLFLEQDSFYRKEVLTNILNHNPNPDRKNSFYFSVHTHNRIVYELVLNDLLTNVDYPVFSDLFKQVFLTGNFQQVASKRKLETDVVLYAYTYIQNELRKIYSEEL